MTTQILKPNAPGDETNLTLTGAPTNWQAVRDPSGAVNWGDPQYWRRDFYNVDAPSGGSGVISKITVYTYSYHAGTEAQQNQEGIKIACKSGTSIGEVAKMGVGGEWEWREYSQDWALNPDTGQPWTWLELGSLQIGVSHRSGIQGGAWGWASQLVWVVVTYESISVPTVTTDPATEVT